MSCKGCGCSEGLVKCFVYVSWSSLIPPTADLCIHISQWILDNPTAYELCGLHGSSLNVP